MASTQFDSVEETSSGDVATPSVSPNRRKVSGDVATPSVSPKRKKIRQTILFSRPEWAPNETFATNSRKNYVKSWKIFSIFMPSSLEPHQIEWSHGPVAWNIGTSIGRGKLGWQPHSQRKIRQIDWRPLLPRQSQNRPLLPRRKEKIRQTDALGGNLITKKFRQLAFAAENKKPLLLRQHLKISSNRRPGW